MASGLTLKLPVVQDDLDGLKLVKNFPELVEQNIKNLFLTIPGERIMDPTFGVGLPKYLFQQNTPAVYAEIRSRADEQVKKYMPFVTINSITFSSNQIEEPDGFLANPGISTNDYFVGMSINYTIVPIKTTRTMNL
jgi:phage baseplate assembly protein W